MDFGGFCDSWNRSVERLQKQCSQFSGGIIFGLAQEEMKMRRDDLDKRIEAHIQ